MLEYLGTHKDTMDSTLRNDVSLNYTKNSNSFTCPNRPSINTAIKLILIKTSLFCYLREYQGIHKMVVDSTYGKDPFSNGKKMVKFDISTY